MVVVNTSHQSTGNNLTIHTGSLLWDKFFFFFGVCVQKSTQPFPRLVAHTTERRGGPVNTPRQHKKPQTRAREEKTRRTTTTVSSLRSLHVVCTRRTTSCVLGALLRRVLGVDLDVVVRQVAPPRGALSFSLAHGDVNLHRAMV